MFTNSPLIHRLPPELLALVFEACSRNEWKSPALLSLVCHKWRDIVSTSPRVWSSFLIDDNKQVRDLYFEKSSQCLLHVHCNTDIALPEDVAMRVQWMSLKRFPEDGLVAHCFSSLERLSIHDPTISLISARRFPALRHLALPHAGFPYQMDCSLLPPLESLELRVYAGNDKWLEFICHNYSNLTSLFLHIEERSFQLAKTPIDLPNLSYLQIEGRRKSDMSSLCFNVPSLKVYIDDSTVVSRCCRIENAARSITHVRLHVLPSFKMLPNLYHLQLQLFVEDYRRLFETIKTGTASLNHLRKIELSDYWLNRGFIQAFSVELGEWVTSNRPKVVPVLVDVWKEELPWEPYWSCGDRMPCRPY